MVQPQATSTLLGSSTAAGPKRAAPIGDSADQHAAAPLTEHPPRRAHRPVPVPPITVAAACRPCAVSSSIRGSVKHGNGGAQPVAPGTDWSA